jgi:hypothetical protein
MARLASLTLLVIFMFAAAVSQTYKKKVVSYVDKVLVPSQFQLTADQTDYIERAVAKSINFERFSYAPLPDTVVASFRAEASGLKRYTPDDVKPVLNRTLAPQLLHVLDLNKELLSRQNLSETERNTFLATKAKSAGLSASQLEAILNSGYFYIPFVEQYSHTVKRDVREEKDDKGKVTKKVPTTKYEYELALGLLWYKLNVDASNNVSVVFIGRSQGWKGGAISRSSEKDGDPSDSEDRKVFRDVVEVNCKNIGLETKRLDAFKLRGGVTEVSATGMRLSLGTREGVGLDDTYWIEENEETESGQIIKTRRGFVKVRSVGNNRKDPSATSYAQVITGTNYSAGLDATELPLLGINALLSFTTFPARVSTFNQTFAIPPSLVLDNAQYDFGIKVLSESKPAVGAMAAVQMSLAHTANISELWFHVGGNIGITSVDGKFYVPTFNSSKQITGRDSVDIGASLTGNISAGLVKKFYFRRYGLILQADVKYSLLRMSAKGKDETNSDDVTYKLTNGALGFDGRAGLEVYLSPTFSIGAAAEYDLYGVANSYTSLVSDKDNNDITKKTDITGPDIKYGGLGYYVWINYSLPSFF